NRRAQARKNPNRERLGCRYWWRWAESNRRPKALRLVRREPQESGNPHKTRPCRSSAYGGVRRCISVQYPYGSMRGVMARNDIDKATVRNKLPPRREPYWGAPVERGLYVGFRRLAQGGNWIARYHTEDRRHVYHSLGPVSAENDYEAAARAAKRWRRTVDAGVQADRVLTVADVVDQYADALEAEGRAAAAIDARKRFQRTVHGDALGKLRADKLTQRHLEAWMTRLEAGQMTGRKKGLPSRATINRTLTPLKAALNRAVSRREIPQDRAIEWESVKPHRNADGRRVVYLDRDQRRRLLEAAPSDLRDFLSCIALTGCRP